MPAGQFDGLLLTSASAIRLAGSLPDLPVHAVGEATAKAATSAGARVITVGEGGIDELLTRLPAELRLLHLCGEERIAPEGPRQQIVAVSIYRAEPLPLPGPAELDRRVLLIHSPAAGRRIGELAADRGAIRIAAISPAAATACGSGWERLEAAERPTDAALLSLAAELCKD
jgi:uroporphyrinogen-III synthase